MSEDRSMAKAEMLEMDVRFHNGQGEKVGSFVVKMEIGPKMTLAEIAERYFVPSLSMALNALSVPFRDVTSE